MARPPAGSAGRPDAASPDVRSWVERSCAAQGVSVTIGDGVVLGNVAALLGATAPLDAPDGCEATRVEAVVPTQPGADDDVVEDGGDDRPLAA